MSSIQGKKTSDYDELDENGLSDNDFFGDILSSTESNLSKKIKRTKLSSLRKKYAGTGKDNLAYGTVVLDFDTLDEFDPQPDDVKNNKLIRINEEGKGGLFKWNPLVYSGADGGMIIQKNNGQLERIAETVNVKHFGAKDDYTELTGIAVTGTTVTKTGAFSALDVGKLIYIEDFELQSWSEDATYADLDTAWTNVASHIEGDILEITDASLTNNNPEFVQAPRLESYSSNTQFYVVSADLKLNLLPEYYPKTSEITAFIDEDNVTIADSAGSPISARDGYFGTNNEDALQAAIDYFDSKPGTVYIGKTINGMLFGEETGSVVDIINIKSNVTIKGDNSQIYITPDKSLRDLFDLQGVTNVTFSGIKANSRNRFSGSTLKNSVNSYVRFAVLTSNCSEIYFDNIRLEDINHIVKANDSNNLHFNNIYSKNHSMFYLDGVEDATLKNFYFEGAKFGDTNGHNFYYASTISNCKRINVSNGNCPSSPATHTNIISSKNCSFTNVSLGPVAKENQIFVTGGNRNLNFNYCDFIGHETLYLGGFSNITGGTGANSFKGINFNNCEWTGKFTNLIALSSDNIFNSKTVKNGANFNDGNFNNIDIESAFCNVTYATSIKFNKCSFDDINWGTRFLYTKNVKEKYIDIIDCDFLFIDNIPAQITFMRANAANELTHINWIGGTFKDYSTGIGSAIIFWLPGNYLNIKDVVSDNYDLTELKLIHLYTTTNSNTAPFINIRSQKTINGDSFKLYETGKNQVKGLTDGANIEWDLSYQKQCEVTLEGDRTLDNPDNKEVGYNTLKVIQDATGGRVLTFDTDYVFTGNTSNLINPEADGESLFYFYCDGSSMLCIKSEQSDNYVGNFERTTDQTFTHNTSADLVNFALDSDLSEGSGITYSPGEFECTIAGKYNIQWNDFYARTDNVTDSDDYSISSYLKLQRSGESYNNVWFDYASMPDTDTVQSIAVNCNFSIYLNVGDKFKFSANVFNRNHGSSSNTLYLDEYISRIIISRG